MKTKVLLSTTKIHARVKQLAKKISLDYQGKNLVLVPVLKGSVIFFADLIRCLTIPCRIDFIAVKSYTGTKSSGVPQLVMDLRESPKGKDILLIEDIVDSGLTLNFVQKNILSRKPHSLKVCSLLKKKSSQKIKVKVAYLGFNIPNKFVVGYGLDYNEKYRNLPYICVVES